MHLLRKHRFSQNSPSHIDCCCNAGPHWRRASHFAENQWRTRFCTNSFAFLASLRKRQTPAMMYWFRHWTSANPCGRFFVRWHRIGIQTEERCFTSFGGLETRGATSDHPPFFIWQIANQAETTSFRMEFRIISLRMFFNPIKISSKNDPISHFLLRALRSKSRTRQIGSCDIFTRKSQTKFIPHWFSQFFNPDQCFVENHPAAPFCCFRALLTILHIFRLSHHIACLWHFVDFHVNWDFVKNIISTQILQIFIPAEISSKMSSRPTFFRFLVCFNMLPGGHGEKRERKTREKDSKNCEIREKCKIRCGLTNDDACLSSLVGDGISAKIDVFAGCAPRFRQNGSTLFLSFLVPHLL